LKPLKYAFFLNQHRHFPHEKNVILGVSRFFEGQVIGVKLYRLQQTVSSLGLQKNDARQALFFSVR
jgi:hypothetical protein